MQWHYRKIERRERGIYYFLVNDLWCYFGVIGAEVAVHVVAGDSLVKGSGENRILIYKRDLDGKLDDVRSVDF